MNHSLDSLPQTHFVIDSSFFDCKKMVFFEEGNTENGMSQWVCILQGNVHNLECLSKLEIQHLLQNLLIEMNLQVLFYFDQNLSDKKKGCFKQCN